MRSDESQPSGNQNQGDGRRPIAYIVSMGAGLEAFIYREIEALYARGFTVVLFATRFRRGDVFSPKPEWPCHVLPAKRLVIAFPLLFFRALLRPGLFLEAVRYGAVADLIFATRFAPLMRRHGVRQIHSHFGDHKFFIGYFCKRLTGLPLSVTIHAHEFYTNPNPALFRRALAETDRVFPIARRWYRRLHQEYAVPEARMHLNHLFVDTGLYRPSNEVKVLAVGRFTERKGFQYLLEAAQQLQDLNVRFLLVGFGEIDFCKLAGELGVEDRVTVFDKMDQAQLRIMYQAADILCVPSITTEREGAEGIPVVLMEGMACSLPVVATRCGAIDEIVDEFLIDEHSPQQIAEAIRTLALDPGLRRAQGERNRKIVVAGFSANNVDRFGEWLDEIGNDAN